MTRIIAGAAAATALTVPPSGTRPTSERVREAVFSALEARGAIDSAEVLDLYAGSGALGLEALSRGAARAVLVERGPKAVAACRRNASAVAARLGREAARVVPGSVSSYLTSATTEVDLVFVDPPYDLPTAELVEALTAIAGILHRDGLVVVERGARGELPTIPGLTVDRAKRYGDTEVVYLERTDR